MTITRNQLTTNLGRVQYSGAHKFGDQREIAQGIRNSEWVRLSTSQPAKIHGLAFDVPEYVKGDEIENHFISGFGVCQDTSLPLTEEKIQPPLLPIYPGGPTLPSPSSTPDFRLDSFAPCLSTASLDNIATLHVRKGTRRTSRVIKNMVCGLRLVHHDSTVETLGRWDPRDTASAFKLYDASEGCLRTLNRLTVFWRILLLGSRTVHGTSTLWKRHL